MTNDQDTFTSRLAKFSRSWLLSFLIAFMVAFTILAACIHDDYAFRFGMYLFTALCVPLLVFPDEEEAKPEDQET